MTDDGSFHDNVVAFAKIIEGDGRIELLNEEGLELLEAYSKIADAEIRKSILEFIDVLGQSTANVVREHLTTEIP